MGLWNKKYILVELVGYYGTRKLTIKCVLLKNDLIELDHYTMVLYQLIAPSAVLRVEVHVYLYMSFLWSSNLKREIKSSIFFFNYHITFEPRAHFSQKLSFVLTWWYIKCSHNKNVLVLIFVIPEKHLDKTKRDISFVLNWWHFILFFLRKYFQICLSLLSGFCQINESTVWFDPHCLFVAPLMFPMSSLNSSLRKWFRQPSQSLLLGPRPASTACSWTRPHLDSGDNKTSGNIGKHWSWREAYSQQSLQDRRVQQGQRETTVIHRWKTTKIQTLGRK